jgi:hypothetical protein
VLTTLDVPTPIKANNFQKTLKLVSCTMDKRLFCLIIFPLTGSTTQLILFILKIVENVFSVIC